MFYLNGPPYNRPTARKSLISDVSNVCFHPDAARNLGQLSRRSPHYCAFEWEN